MLGQFTLFKPDETAKLRNRIQLEPISVADARYTLEQFHYLRRARTGRQINYAIIINGVVDGVLTYAYPMMSAPLHNIPSDEVLEFARLFLESNIPHSASCAIGKSLKRIKRDWMNKFPDAKEPRMVVSWSDTTRHKGTIYKAANFEWSHLSKGASHGNSPNSKRGKRKKHTDYRNDKDCWIYHLR